MAEYTPNNTNSKVHTAELMLLSSEGVDMNRNYIYDSRITGTSTQGWRDGADVSYLRFNPNGLKVFSKQTSRYIPMGDCESLADFRLHVADWAQKEQIPV